jgi:cytochrome c
MRSFTPLAALMCLTMALAAPPVLAEGDPAAGKKVFNKCKACHSLEAGQNKIGPTLAGVFGRAAGSVDGFKYSDAMKSSDLSWSEESLMAYLANPKEFMPGNRMAFPGIKKEDEMENLLAFLKEASE